MDGSGVWLELSREILMPTSSARNPESDTDQRTETRERRRPRMHRSTEDKTQRSEEIEAAEHQLDDLA